MDRRIGGASLAASALLCFTFENLFMSIIVVITSFLCSVYFFMGRTAFRLFCKDVKEVRARR